MDKPLNAAIVDYGICNMFSVKHACERVGLQAVITSSIAEMASADVIILPGVGAFGSAMEALRKLDLIHALRDLAASGKPFIGICLGHQLLFTESHEFDIHKGLDIIPGVVKPFESTADRPLKVPHVGWNQVAKPKGTDWKGTPFEGIDENSYAYFCHSYYVVPEDKTVPLTITQYGPFEFASSVRKGNILTFQFHPEKSGSVGMTIYQNIARLAANQRRLGD